MNRSQRIQLLSLAEIATVESKYVIADAYAKLQTLSRQLNNADTRSCNSVWHYTGNADDKEYTEQDHEEEMTKISKRIDSITEVLKLFWYHQSNPRGASLYIMNYKLSPENYNNGIAIY